MKVYLILNTPKIDLWCEQNRSLVFLTKCVHDVEKKKLWLSPFFPEEDSRRPGQRPTTAMLGNEVMNKEQLYDLYQQILGVKKFEHQLLYNAMQVRLSSLKCIRNQ